MTAAHGREAGHDDTTVPSPTAACRDSPIRPHVAAGCVPHMAIDKPLVLTLIEAAEYLGISRRHLTRLINDHGLPTVRIGGKRVVIREQLEQWAYEQQRRQQKDTA